MPKLVALLRAKDAKAFLGSWLENIGPLVDEIVAVDNGSSDGTFEQLESHPKVTLVERTEGFDEGRDKNLLYDLARRREAEWLLWLDVDEWFEEGMDRRRLEEMMSDGRWVQYRFRRFHFADETHYNASPYWVWYMSRHDRVLWRDQPSGRFVDVPFNNGNVAGILGPTRRSHVRLKHMGSAYPEPLRRKLTLYRSLDPSLEATYERISRPSRVVMTWAERKTHPFRAKLMDFGLDFVQVVRAAVSRAGRLKRRG